MARVQPHRSGLRKHMMLVVHADRVDHLVDVGFGAGMLYPVPLPDGAVVDQAGWEHRLVDYEVAHHVHRDHPRSPFTGQLVVMRLDHGVSRRFTGDELTVEYAHGHLERTTIPPDRLDATLPELDVVLDTEDSTRCTLAGCYRRTRGHHRDVCRPVARECLW